MNYQASFNELSKTFSVLIPLSGIPLVNMLSKVGIHILQREVTRIAQKPVKNMINIYLQKQREKDSPTGGTTKESSHQVNSGGGSPQKGTEKEKTGVNLDQPLTVAAGGIGLGLGGRLYSALSDIPKVLTSPLFFGATILTLMDKR